MKKHPTRFLLLLTLCLPGLALGQVMTVQGPIQPGDMGLTLIHEHVLVDWVGADSTSYHRWDRDQVVARALPYFRELKALGVETFLDCTPAYLGRDPWVLQSLSEQSGIQILTNTGYYGSGNNKFVPASAHTATAEELAELWTEEFEKGIDGSGIRPGFLKMSVENEATLSPMHQKLVRAAALTHLATGLTIVSHTGGDGPALAQLQILQEMGVSPGAFVWTHAQGGTLDGYLEAARQGAWISLDHVNAGENGQGGNIGWYVQTLTALKAAGVLDHILLSHDAGWYNVGQENGGYFRPYTDLFTHLIPQLKAHGFTQADLDLLLVDNPRRAYTVRVRQITQEIPLPPNYTIVDSIFGDLDQDGVDELVVAYNTAPEDEILGVPRELIIYKQQNGVWTFWKRSREALFGSKDGGMMGDPYGHMKIVNGQLSITQNGGSSWKWSQTDTYRCEDDECYLIEFTSTYGKPCEYWQTVNFNLRSGHIAVTKDFEDCDSEAVFKTENETFTTEQFRITLETRQQKEIVVESPTLGHRLYLAIGKQ